MTPRLGVSDNVPYCFVEGCTQPSALARSWYNGPTIEACHEHKALLPHKRPDETAARQGVLR